MIIKNALLLAPEGVEAPAGGPAPVESPNAGWQSDTSLDSNGNPIVGAQKTVVPPSQQNQEPAAEQPESGAGEEAPSEDKTKAGEPADYATLSANYQKVATQSVGKQITTALTDAGVDAAGAAEAVRDNGGIVTVAIAKALVEKHGELTASLIVSQMESVHKAGVAMTTAADNAVYAHVAEEFKGVTDQGGKETWSELSKWAKTNIPSGERAEINKLLSGGPIHSKLAVQELVARFKKSNDFNQTPELEAGSGTSTHSGVVPLTRTEYTNQMRALEGKGHVYGQSREMAELDKRRQAAYK